MPTLTVKHKFILAGALAFASMMSMLFLGQYSTQKIKSFDAVSLEISRVESGMLMLRRNEKDFLARNDLKYKGKFEKNFTVLEESVSTL